jgi:hypothetical protein
MHRTAFAAAFTGALTLATALTTSANAQQDRVRVGTLECSVSSGVGLIVGSQRNVNCLFKPDYGPPEAYQGGITRVGLDVGVTTGGAFYWTVFAGTNRYAGMLAGSYVGASAEATIAAGLGADVLVGGSDRTVALQPLAIQGQAGLDVAAGATKLDLRLAQ